MLECRPTKLILPLREGEQIEHPSRIPEGRMYALTYPGTASSRCLVIYQEDVNVFIGGAPSFEYTQIMLRRVGQEDFQLIFNSTDHEYYFIPFEEDWKEAADRFKKELGLKGQQPFQGQPRYMLQMGVKRPNGDTYIRHFEELLPAVELFHQHFGEGHIVHLFGTNKDGYDRMFPDYTIDPAVGGEAALRKLLEEIRGYNLLTSHHYNPRLADTDWIRVNPDYKDAIVRRDGREVIEPYAGQYHYVMNLNHDRWYDRCMETVNYLSDLGFDYLEIDQFVYQRNFYDPHKPLALGYKRMVDDFIARGQKFWVEGLSDVFRFPAGNFCQILIRDRSQLWEDGENRRGYPYGHTYADFFMYLWPDTEVSYQIFTEHKLFERIEERFRKARHIHAAVYDIELGFFDESYIPNLKRLIETLERHGLR
ncbi:MAG: hypothetical protein D6681_22865 [Calditrichaeota bacterium]|nr:MAG: hypothetical protein D6681_22865 [Calditrichota bacterium]